MKIRVKEKFRNVGVGEGVLGITILGTAVDQFVTVKVRVTCFYNEKA